MICLLFADAFVGFRGIFSINEAASRLVEDQYLQMSLIDEVQREQEALSAVFYRLGGDPDSVDRPGILTQIDAIEQDMQSLVSKVPIGDREIQTWRQVATASTAFAGEAKRLLSLEGPPSFYSRELLRRHEAVVGAVASLIRSSHHQAELARAEIARTSTTQLREDSILLGACLVLACLCAVLVLRTASKLYRRMGEQSEELSRVSWQLLDSQELVAGRLSHDLHDELGQVLTALKMNLSRHADAPCVDQAWMQDCSQLLKESMHSAHEISQLLRPTILDDFGLDSALTWLCERFEERSKVEVQYSANFQRRLAKQTETHLFRIAQEALTNVSRHSGASLVEVRLRLEDDRVWLLIKDNGKGLPPPGQIRPNALGLTGMRARARSSGGALTIRGDPGQGVSIEVWVPLEKRGDEKEDPHLVG